MKKNIVRLIFLGFLFIVMLGIGMNMNFSPEKESFIDNNKALAQSGAGRICANISTDVCTWYNEDGSIDYMDNGEWAPEPL